jgi:twinkle protein
MVGFLTGEVQALPKRGLDVETCRKFNYRVGKNAAGKTVQIADYRKDGVLVAQKIRGADKSFTITGDGKDLPLWGQHLWAATGRRVVITEGEVDAMSIAQAAGLSWPVVSLPGGAKSAKKAILRASEWLEGYETVVLAFDMDEPGREAAAECAPLLSPGKCAIWEIPRKDANEMLVAGEVKALSSALWGARVYRPDGIVSLGDIEARVLADPPVGRPWFLPGLTKATFGRRPGDVIGLGGGTGCGKTDFVTQQIAYDVMELGLTVGVIYLEQGVGETGRRIAGKIGHKRFHVPGDGWTQEELKASWGALKATGRLHLYDNWGAMDWATIRSKIRYMVTALGVQVCYLDHLTALAAAEDDERKALEKILAEAAGDAQALGHNLIFVSHLATPDGKPHEENGRVMVRHFKGSRAIGFWSHNLFGIERDTQTPGKPTVLRCLKDRFTGQSNGTLIGMQYDSKTGLLSECELTNESDSNGFRDESGPNTDF